MEPHQRLPVEEEEDQFVGEEERHLLQLHQQEAELVLYALLFQGEPQEEEQFHAVPVLVAV